MRTLLTAVVIAGMVALLEGCAGTAERLADKCYAFGGKAQVRAAGDAIEVGCR